MGKELGRIVAGPIKYESKRPVEMRKSLQIAGLISDRVSITTNPIEKRKAEAELKLKKTQFPVDLRLKNIENQTNPKFIIECNDLKIAAPLITSRQMSPERISQLAQSRLDMARQKLYHITGGSMDSEVAGLSRMTSAQRVAYFKSEEFRAWVASEKNQGKRIFWLKDLDKTQGAGDIFTFFFDWRAKNRKFTDEQNLVLRSFLKNTGFLSSEEAELVDKNDAAANAAKVIDLWKRDEEGQSKGISLIQFWTEAYWPSQKGLTRKEKKDQVSAFAPHYASKIFPGVVEENLALKEAGVDVVIISNGDQELCEAVAPLLGINPRNRTGAKLLYNKEGFSTGKMHTYEIYDKEWSSKPQPGKVLNFRYFVNANKWRGINGSKMVVAGIDGDSAASDGGLMIYFPPAIGSFMVNTPGEPGRIQKFIKFANKYGAWERGRFITLDYEAPAK